jgi:restriction endonuclease S subunit
MPRDLTPTGDIDESNVARIGEQDYLRLARYHLREGDVLVARRGEIGRRGVVTAHESGWVCGTGSLIIRPGNLLDPKFLSYAFETAAVRVWLDAHAIGTTMKNLSSQILSGMPVMTPPLAEQQQIAKILLQMDIKIKSELRLVDTLESVFASLLHHLMTGKVRVSELDAAFPTTGAH